MVNGLLAGLLPWADLFEFSGSGRRRVADAPRRVGPPARARRLRAELPRRLGPGAHRGARRRSSASTTSRVTSPPRCAASRAARRTRWTRLTRSRRWHASCGRRLERAPSNAWRLSDCACGARAGRRRRAAAGRRAPPRPCPCGRRPRTRGLAALAPDWDRPETWLAPLAAYLSAAAPERRRDALRRRRRERPRPRRRRRADGRPRASTSPATRRSPTSPSSARGEAPPAGACRCPTPPRCAPRSASPPRTSPRSTPRRSSHRARWAQGARGRRCATLAELRRYEPRPSPGPSERAARDRAHPDLERRRQPARPRDPVGARRRVPERRGARLQRRPRPGRRAAVAAVGDRRVRYLELPERPVYASHPHSFWETAGIRAVNAALDEARGAWIAPLDHDDAFTHDHIADAARGRPPHPLDMVYGDALCERARRRARRRRQPGSCSTAASATARRSTRRASRHLRYDEHSWLHRRARRLEPVASHARAGRRRSATCRA